MNKFKVQFHAHTKSDPEDCLFHSDKELIERASHHGYDVLAITCHNKIVFNKELEEYAKQKGILLIPGIEKSVCKNHVVIINAKPEVENIHDFEALEKYKNENPDSLIFAAHPYHPFPLGVLSLKNNLDKHNHLFDAIEFSSFYSKNFDFNRKAVAAAKKYNKPMLGTADNHVLEFLNHTYSYVYATSKSKEDIINAIKNGNVEIMSKPMNLFRIGLMTLRLTFLEYGRKFINLFRNQSL
jgi:predicted metal-dependent phosphoesterase TrpH